MALSAQDKILYVANKLGLSTLGNMQGSTPWITLCLLVLPSGISP
jgi:hypothetical protein